MIIGNDVMGGINAVFGVVCMAAMQSVYVLQDDQLNLDVVPFLKNVECVGFPPEPKANVVTQDHSPISKLFRSR